MLDALDRGDFETVEFLGHGMRGAGGMFGFQTITDIGAALEQAAESADADTPRNWVGEFSMYLDRIEIISDQGVSSIEPYGNDDHHIHSTQVIGKEPAIGPTLYGYANLNVRFPPGTAVQKWTQVVGGLLWPEAGPDSGSGKQSQPLCRGTTPNGVATPVARKTQ